MNTLVLVKSAAAVIGVMIYLLPAVIADTKGRDEALAITGANIILGWTIVGWFAVLVWAKNEAKG